MCARQVFFYEPIFDHRKVKVTMKGNSPIYTVLLQKHFRRNSPPKLSGRIGTGHFVNIMVVPSVSCPLEVGDVAP